MARLTLTEARNLAGLTITALAQQAGISVSHVSNLEAGRGGSPSHETVLRIWRVLNEQMPGLRVEDIVLSGVKDASAVRSSESAT